MMPLGQRQRQTTGDIVKFMTRGKLHLGTRPKQWDVRPMTTDEALVPFDEKYTISDTKWNYLGISCKGGKINGVLMNTEMFLIGIVSVWNKLSMYSTNFSKIKWQTFKNSVQKAPKCLTYETGPSCLQKSRRCRLGGTWLLTFPLQPILWQIQADDLSCRGQFWGPPQPKAQRKHCTTPLFPSEFLQQQRRWRRICRPPPRGWSRSWSTRQPLAAQCFSVSRD